MSTVQRAPIPETDYAGRRVVPKPLDGEVDGKLVGVSFAADYPRGLLIAEAAFAVDPARRWAPAVLVREPDNPYDTNAVRFDLPGIGPIGHIPAALAARLAPELDIAEPWGAACTGVLRHQHGQDQVGVTYRLRRFADETAKAARFTLEHLTRWLEDVESVRAEVSERAILTGNNDEIEAKYAGWCHQCGRPIEPGDRLRRRAKNREWIHARCSSPAITRRPHSPQEVTVDRRPG